MVEELKACPFCNGKGVVRIGYHSIVDAKVTCETCGAEGQIFGDEALAGDFTGDAARAWNNRIVAPDYEADENGMAFVNGMGWVVQCRNAAGYVQKLKDIVDLARTKAIAGGGA